MARKKQKRPRGSRGVREENLDGAPSSKGGAACDLMVLMPKNVSKLHAKLQVAEIMGRLDSTGYTHMALTHTIYGRPRPKEDLADEAIPTSLWSQNSTRPSDDEPVRKKPKTTDESSKKPPKIKVLRRIHAVLENSSDVGTYLANGPHESLLKEYDLVSVSPRTDETFQSACASATMADIITLDYSATRGFRLPFKIRPSDVQAVVDRQAAFEIPLAPALLNGKQRKALVQTCRELQMGCLGKKPLVIFSSGDRTLEESDVGAMAFRMPGDVSNLMQTVAHFDPTTAHRAMGAASVAILKRASDRRWGKSDVVNVTIGGKVHDDKSGDSGEGKQRQDEESDDDMLALEPITSKQKEDEPDNGGIEDGFICMT